METVVNSIDYGHISPQSVGPNQLLNKKILAIPEALQGELTAEGISFIEAMNQSFSQQLIYGDTSVNPDGILGLTPRYNSLAAQSGQNIIDAGGTGEVRLENGERVSVSRDRLPELRKRLG